MLLSPTTGPMNSIDNMTSTLDNGGSSRFLGGGLGGSSQLFSSAQGFFGAGPIMPSSLEDKASIGSPAGGPFTIKVQNLPRDITDREFKVLFTFAPEFMYAELHKSSNAGDDGLPLNVFGHAHFKKYASAVGAQSLLDMRADIFFNGPLRCELLREKSGSVSGPDNENSVNHSASYESLGKGRSSRFVFSESSSNASNGYDIPEQTRSSSSPRSLFPIGSIDGAVSGTIDDHSLYSSGSSNQFGVSHQHQGLPPPGKSLLLESRDDDEFNTLVKDPVRFFARDSGFMGFPPNASNNASSVSTMPTNGPTSPPGELGPPGPPSQAGQSVKSASNTSNGSSSASSRTIAPIASQASTTQESASTSPISSSSSTSPPSRGIVNGLPHLTPAPPPAQNQWDKRRTAASVVANAAANSATGNNAVGNGTATNSTTRQFSQLSINTDKANASQHSVPAVSTGNGDPSKVVVPYSPTNNSQAIQIMQNGGRVLPPANPADQNPPCNTLYVGNLPPDTSEDELKDLFSSRRGYKRLCFRTKANGPMCFVEFEDANYAGRALEELYGFGLSNSVKGGIRLSFSKNPLGVRGNGNGSSSNNGNNGTNGVNPNNASNGRYNRYHGSVNYAEAATQGYMK